MLQGANTDPLVPKVHNSVKIYYFLHRRFRNSHLKLNWQIFIYCTLGTKEPQFISSTMIMKMYTINL